MLLRIQPAVRQMPVFTRLSHHSAIRSRPADWSPLQLAHHPSSPFVTRLPFHPRPPPSAPRLPHPCSLRLYLTSSTLTLASLSSLPVLTRFPLSGANSSSLRPSLSTGVLCPAGPLSHHVLRPSSVKPCGLALSRASWQGLRAQAWSLSSQLLASSGRATQAQWRVRQSRMRASRVPARRLLGVRKSTLRPRGLSGIAAGIRRRSAPESLSSQTNSLDGRRGTTN